MIRLSHQLLTRDWWANARPNFDLRTSDLVLQECAAGDATAAAERLNALTDIPLLAITPEVVSLAGIIAGALKLPERSKADAIHVATAAVHHVDYLLTWNCRHLANAALADKIEQACATLHRTAPRIVTPEQLMELP